MNNLTITGPTPGDSEICNEILRSVPEWFGIEDAIIEYTRVIEKLPTFYAKCETKIAGLLSVKQHFSGSAEIYLMAVHRDWHRKGLGRKLLRASEEWLSESGVKFVQVKTLGESRENKEYEATRRFYEKMGFMKLEEFLDLWPEGNPCLQMVKKLEPNKSVQTTPASRRV